MADRPTKKWAVYAVDRKGKRFGNPVLIEARSRDRALACAHRARAVLGLPRARNIEATEYLPELDPALLGFVAPMPSACGDKP